VTQLTLVQCHFSTSLRQLHLHVDTS